MKPDKRQSKILVILDQQETATVEYLAEFFDVSHETIRRDLSALYEQHLIRKVHGGAEKAQTASEAPFEVRSHFNHEQKTAIARYAATLVSSGDSLLINSGTTTIAFANELQKLQKLMVITNCATVAHEVWRACEQSNQVYLVGGKYNGDFIETNGSITLEQIRLFQADHAFLTVGAINPSIGIMEYRVDAAQLSRIMIEQAHYITVLADSSKLDQIALAKICSLADIDRLITDTSPSQELIQALEAAEVELHIAT
jgi:DeoR/GlpR family transcriptional regulator of sugar metabolism